MTETPFGDGYEVITPNGINSTKQSVTLRWTNINSDEFDTIYDFLNAQKEAQSPFYYTAPKSVQKPYLCKALRHAQVDVEYYTISATLGEYHGA